MFNDSVNEMFKGMFGKLEPGTCKITANGNIAVRTSKGYKAYNVKKGILTNVSSLCFSADEMFFVIPTNKVAVGDIIFVHGKPRCVISVEPGSKVIEVIDYENSEIKRITPERHIFMGSTYFYGKIVSMFGNAFKNGKGLKSVIKMMMLTSMMGGNKGNNGGNGGNGGNGDMMGGLGMMMLLGGGGNMFDGLFDIDLDVDEDDENPLAMLAGDDDEDDDEPVAKPAKKAKKATKVTEEE